MSAIYELIGRAVVGYIRVRYRRQLRIAAGLAAATALLGAYLLAQREVEEG